MIGEYIINKLKVVPTVKLLHLHTIDCSIFCFLFFSFPDDDDDSNLPPEAFLLSWHHVWSFPSSHYTIYCTLEYCCCCGGRTKSSVEKVNCALICFTSNQSWILISPSAVASLCCCCCLLPVLLSDGCCTVLQVILSTVNLKQWDCLLCQRHTIDNIHVGILFHLSNISKTGAQNSRWLL